MGQISIYGDIESSSIYFVNSTVNPKGMGTVEAFKKSDEERIVIIRTDKFEEDGVSYRKLFKRLNPNRIQNRNGEDLINTLGFDIDQVIDYLNEQFNLDSGTSGGDGSGTDMTGIAMDFVRDATSTSIMSSTGHEFGVNTIKAVPDENGLIRIDYMRGDLVRFKNIDFTLATIDGQPISGGLNDVVNKLNEYFTVGAFEAVVISDPFSTMVADVGGIPAGYTEEGNTFIDPLGDEIATNSTSCNYAGIKSVETINQVGEYFTFDIRGKSTYGFGLVHSDASYANGKFSGNSSYADPSTFCVTNSHHSGFQFSHWFHIGNAHASWTNYGANTSYNMGAAWYDHNNQFDEKEDWNNNDPVTMKVGLDENGFISISTKKDDGTFVLHARSNYPVPEGAEFHLGVKLYYPSAKILSEPKAHLLEEEAPVMYFRYIESPDGVFHYPLFATKEEADYYYEIMTGAETGLSHTHVYPDDPTNTVWHMPDNGQMNGVNAPYNMVFNGQTVLFTEITSLTNADLTPTAFSDTTITVDELTQVNYQLSPVDVDYVTTIGGIPAWSISGNLLQGIAPEVADDNVTNPSDTTTVTVYRTRNGFTSSGTLTIIINNLTPPTSAPSGFTLTEGSMADADTLDSGSVVTLDDTLAVGKRLIVPKSWVETNVLPNITGSLEKAYIGFASPSANWSNAPDLHIDFDAVMRWEGQSSNAHKSTLADGSDIVARSENSVGSTTNAYYNYAIQWDGTDLVVMADVDAAKLANEHDYTQMQRYSAYENYAEQSGALPLVFATKSGGQLDVTMTGISFADIPSAPITNQTSWSKALDFSGSSERAQQVTSQQYNCPLRMGDISGTASNNADSNIVSNDSNSRPWATTIVFKIDGNSSNQHVWNMGEGTAGDNIYLRVSASRELYFGWGHDGSYGVNECKIPFTLNTNKWYGFYVASKGGRFNAGNATAANLADAFDIRIMSSDDGFTAVGSNYSTSANWSNGTTGWRTNRSVTGNFTIGGRGTNRSFHGKIASMVITTLNYNNNIPDDNQIKLMIIDPIKWKIDYKDGKQFRYAPDRYQYSSNFTGTMNAAKWSTQIWLMGDGTNDNYSNMIRNQVDPNDQNWTKLNMISMVSNDIQTVNINGLTT